MLISHTVHATTTRMSMGIKGTDDYLTARAANPRTGLISPSILTVQTPRTPMTPGEASRLYSHHSNHSPARLRPALKPRLMVQRNKKNHNAHAANRWKQREGGWMMEAVSDFASPSMTAANIAAAGAVSFLAEDRFIVPMPSAKDPQPYQTVESDITQATAVGRLRCQPVTAYGPSGASTTSCLNRKMPSKGAGPRKFAEASKRLRNERLIQACESRLHSTEARENNRDSNAYPQQGHDISSSPASSVSAANFAPFQSPSKTEGIKSTINAMPNTCDAGGQPRLPATQSLINRKPVGSPPNIRARRTSNVTVATAKSEELSDKTAEVLQPKPNEDRFSDLRRLPRVRIVHPDAAASPDVSGLDVDKDSAGPARPANAVPPPHDVRPRPSLVVPGTSSPPGTTKLESPCLESKVLSMLADMLAFLLRLLQASWHSAQHIRKLNILRALNTLTDEQADPMARVGAVKVLIVAGGRAATLVGGLVVLVRVGVALGRLFQVMLWPVGLLAMTLRWLLGIG